MTLTSEVKTLNAESSYAQHLQLLLTLINQLRAIGAQADLDLPRIAVIGNQSAGKSSLVEAISGINVPRDVGTCTRCPIECHLSNSGDSWSCQVSIRWEFNGDGTRRNEVQEIKFGSTLTDPKDVELVLRRAQAAILNPETSMQHFVTKTAKELRVQQRDQIKFSRNTICVDISGPHLANLAFVDLPGIIQNDSEETVKLVKDLVLSNITTSNCLILVALPMSDDLQNQGAMSLAREVDPSGLRTIGVLTKPDLVTTKQQKELWQEVIDGRREPLKHGYYCTRQPDEDDRMNHITQEEARATEEEFFSTIAPWSTSTHRSRFGTQNLVQNLSMLLTKFIEECLPKLIEETNLQLADCQTRLHALPRPISSEPTSFILNLVTSFCGAIHAYVQGQSLSATLVQRTRRTYGWFKGDIKATVPPFLPYADEKSAGPISREAFQLDEEDEDKDVSASNIIYLNDVRKRIEEAVTRELPNNVPYPAKVSFILEFQSRWEEHARKCTKAVHDHLQDTTDRLINHTFGGYGHLEPRIRRSVEELLKSMYTDTVSQVLKLLKYETSPYTQNNHYLSASKEKLLAHYKDLRATGAKPSISHTPATEPLNQKPTAPFSFQREATVSAQNNPFNVISTTKFEPCGFRWSSPGTKSTPYTETIIFDNATHITMSDISCMPAFQNWSSEELRTADYGYTRKGAAGFGQPSMPQAVESPTPESTGKVSQYERKEEEDKILAGLAKLGFHGLTAADFGKLVPTDEFQEELEVMAEVCAYFKVAYKRVIDYVPLAIDHDLLYAFSESLQAHLVEKLGLGTKDAAEKCAGYLEEDPHIKATREELSVRKKRLESVYSELTSFNL